MEETDREKLLQYGISCEEVIVYRYKSYRYENVADAINYAVLDRRKSSQAEVSIAGHKKNNRD